MDIMTHTFHKMYTDGGSQHQANWTVVVRESDMQVTNMRADIENPLTGYVSYSFDQRILVDSDGKIVTLDQGDGAPRALVLMKYRQPAGETLGTGYDRMVDSVLIQEFEGWIGDNETGCRVGSLVETSEGYLVSYGQQRAYVCCLLDCSEPTGGVHSQ